MKRLTKSIVLASALAVAGSAGAATMLDEVSPYIGVEYKHMFLRGHGRIWSDALPKNYPGGNVFAGVRFMENFGLEAGYSFTASKTRSFTFNNGGFTTTGQVKSRLNSFYLDLMGFMCIDPCWELFGALGIGWVRSNARISSVTITPAGATATAAAAAISGSGDDRSRAIARVRAGVNYMITDCVGARASVGWENTKNVRASGTNFDGAAVTTVLGGSLSNKPYKDAITLALGLFVKF